MLKEEKADFSLFFFKYSEAWSVMSWSERKSSQFQQSAFSWLYYAIAPKSQWFTAKTTKSSLLTSYEHCGSAMAMLQDESQIHISM